MDGVSNGASDTDFTKILMRINLMVSISSSDRIMAVKSGVCKQVHSI